MRPRIPNFLARRRASCRLALSAGLRSTALVLLLSGAAGGCAAEERHAESALEYTENARRDYELALKALSEKNWEVVDQLFNDIRRNYSYSRYARLAELRLADANYEQEKLPEAISGYKAFVHDYPNDPEIPYARFRIAKAEYESVSQSVLLPPLEERDLASVNDALTTIRNYLEDYPGSEHVEDLRYMLEVVVGLLARHELYVARYYLAEDRFDAAAARVGYAIDKFPESGLEAEALLLFAEIRLKQKQDKEARELLERLLREYGESPFSVSARKYLARLGEPVAVRRESAPAGPAAPPPAAPAPVPGSQSSPPPGNL
jgi:outer membrane protein assembly factor BamD